MRSERPGPRISFNRPRRARQGGAKAFSVPADVVMFDLDDGVVARDDEKVSARQCMLQALRIAMSTAAIRTNAPDTAS